jgi:hypothetical protein
LLIRRPGPARRELRTIAHPTIDVAAPSRRGAGLDAAAAGTSAALPAGTAPPLHTAHAPSAGLILAAALLLALAVYAPAFDNGFRDVDFVFLARVRSAAAWLDLVRSAPEFTFYRPAALLLFGFEERLFGLTGGLYLAFNVALHVLNAALAWLLARRLAVPSRTAALGVGLFLVGCGSYGKQVLWACTSGALAALSAGLAAAILGLVASDPALRRRRAAAAVGLLLLLGLAPWLHEAALAAPLAVGLMLVAAPHRPHGRGLAAWIVLLGLPIAVWVVGLQSVVATHPEYGAGWHRLADVPGRLWGYLGLLVWPIQAQGLGWAPRLRGVAALAVGAALAAQLWRGDRRRRIAVALIVVALAPFCLVPMPAGWLEVRYLYAAALPACLLLADAVTSAPAARRRTAAAGLVGLVVATLAFQRGMERKWDALGRAPAQQAQLVRLRGSLPLPP